MKTLNKAILVAAVTLLSGAAFAQAKPMSGWYAGGSIGRSTINPDVGALPAGVSEDKNGTGYKFMAGYQFNTNFALEGQYQHLGKYTASAFGTSVDLKNRGLAFAAVGILPLGNEFSLIGKAGIVSHHFSGSALGSSESDTSGLLGLGAEYNVSPTMAVRAEYEYFGRPDVSGTKVKTDLVSVGLRVRF